MRVGKQLTEAMILNNKERRRDGKRRFKRMTALLEKHIIASYAADGADRRDATLQKINKFKKYVEHGVRLQNEYNAAGDTTARIIRERFLPDAQFVVPLTTRETRLLFETAIHAQQAGDVPFRLLFGHAQDALGAADVSLVASGTATLEAALIKRPMVITYKIAASSWWIGKRLVKLPYVGLPNILAGRFVVPEILQDAATPENLAEALVKLYEDKENAAAVAEAFTDIHLQLRQNNAEKAAAAVIACLN